MLPSHLQMDTTQLRFLNDIFKDVRVKIFQSIYFLKYLLQSDNELLVSEMQKKKMGVTDFVSEIKPVENYPDFKNWRA